MMNLKKIAILGFAPCALLATGCYYREPASNIKTLTHDQAIEWVKSNYGSKDATVTAPKKVESNWSLGGYITDWGKGPKTVYDNLKLHMTNFFTAYSYALDTDEIKATIQKRDDETPAGKLHWDEYAFVTSDTIVGNVNDYIEKGTGSFPSPLRSETMDNTLDSYFFKGATKYNADYVVNEDTKELTVCGTYSVVKDGKYETYDTEDLLKIPYCSVTFNSKGNLKSINFDMKATSEIRYTWYNAKTIGWCDGFAFTALIGSYINFNYIY